MEDLNKARIAFARSKARTLLAEVHICNPPVLINTIVQHLRQTQSLSVKKWSFDDTVDGIQVTVDGESVIGYNDDRHPNRKRFTVAHEIGHFVIGHTQKHYDSDNSASDETEANQFAAELLMPLDMIKRDLKSLKSVKELAKKYVVSEEAMYRRLMDCNLILKISRYR